MAVNKKNVVRLNTKTRPARHAKPVLSNRTFMELPLSELEEPPSYMTPEAAEIYKQLISELSLRGDCQATDRYIIQQFADSVANYRAVRKMLSSSAELIKNKQQNLVSNPLRFALTGERSAVIGVGVQLKLSPKSRLKDKSEVADDEDEKEPEVKNVSEDF